MKLLWELPVFRSNVVGVKTKGFFCVLVLSFKAKIKERGFDFSPWEIRCLRVLSDFIAAFPTRSNVLQFWQVFLSQSSLSCIKTKKSLGD